MKSSSLKVQRFLVSEDAPTAVEYAVPRSNRLRMHSADRTPGHQAKGDALGGITRLRAFQFLVNARAISTIVCDVGGAIAGIALRIY